MRPTWAPKPTQPMPCRDGPCSRAGVRSESIPLGQPKRLRNPTLLPIYPDHPGQPQRVVGTLTGVLAMRSWSSGARKRPYPQVYGQGRGPRGPLDGKPRPRIWPRISKSGPGARIAPDPLWPSIGGRFLPSPLPAPTLALPASPGGARPEAWRDSLRYGEDGNAHHERPEHEDNEVHIPGAHHPDTRTTSPKGTRRSQRPVFAHSTG